MNSQTDALRSILITKSLSGEEKAARVDANGPYKGNALETVKLYDLTPLCLSYRQGQLPLFEVLIKHGANVYAPDGKGDPLLHTMWLNRDVESYIDVLTKYKINLDGKDADGNTAFMKATEIGSCQTMRALAKAGSDITLTNNKGECAQTIADNKYKEAQTIGDIDHRTKVSDTLKEIKQDARISALETTVTTLKEEAKLLTAKNPRFAKQLRTQQRIKAATHKK